MPTMSEPILKTWMKHGEHVAISLTNIKNLLVTLERESPSNTIEIPDVPKVDICNTMAMLRESADELEVTYKALKLTIKKALRSAPIDLQEKYRMWIV